MGEAAGIKPVQCIEKTEVAHSRKWQWIVQILSKEGSATAAGKHGGATSRHALNGDKLRLELTIPKTFKPLSTFTRVKRTHSRRLFASLVKNLAQAIAYDELFAGLHGDGEDTHLVRDGPADAEGRGGGLDAGEDAAGIFICLHLNPRLARPQLLVALSHCEAKLLFVPRDDEGGEAV
jgi:hypothetical protein